MPTPDEFLAHYGVKGMRWGVRKSDVDGVPPSTNRVAKADAREFARAKMFYGEGAGTRRKLIKAKVEAKSKDPLYKKAFDHHLDQQDLGQHASKAKGERRRKDVASSTVKTAKGVHRSLTGGFGSVSLASATLATAYVTAKNTGVDKIVADSMKRTVRDANLRRMNDRQMQDWMRRQGF